MDESPKPVKPEVLYLPQIFREITKGKTRVPAFQRGFVWQRKQVLELLESVFKYYPIGSLLFWEADVGQMQTDTSDKVPFPHPDVSGKVDFVLDGMQRISSLYGAFHTRTGVPDIADPFSVVFDLKSRKFRHSGESTPTCISLRVLFSPKSLLAEQGRLGKLDDGDTLVEATLELQRAFQEYLVPIVRISDRSQKEVVEIFERVNSTGTRLSAVDFMRAITWSTEFDLSKELTTLADRMAGFGFEIPADTIAKCIALSVDVIPTGGELLKLREKSPAELNTAIQRTGDALEMACQFLAERLGILSYDYVPYEGQFLVLVSAAQARLANMPEWLPSWFWNVAFSEAFQGRPDYAVASLAVDVAKAPTSELEEHFALTSDMLITRIVRKGAALSMAMVAAIATTPCYSVFTGKPLASTQFMSRYDNSALAAIYAKGDLERVVEPSPRGDKWISNVVLLDHKERRPYPNARKVRKAILDLADQHGGMDALETQCISASCVDALRRDDVSAFLKARSAALYERAIMLVKGGLRVPTQDREEVGNDPIFATEESMEGEEYRDDEL